VDVKIFGWQVEVGRGGQKHMWVAVSGAKGVIRKPLLCNHSPCRRMQTPRRRSGSHGGGDRSIYIGFTDAMHA